MAKPSLNGKLVWESVIIAHYLAAGCFGLGFSNDDCNGNTGMTVIASSIVLAPQQQQPNGDSM